MKGTIWGTLVLVMTAAPAAALDLDAQRHFSLTGTFYTQARMAVQDSQGPRDIRGGGTQPKVQIGHMTQWRNYLNPVFEADLDGALDLRWIKDLSVRLAGRVVYDAIYDVGADQFRKHLRLYQESAAISPLGGPRPAVVFRGTEPVEQIKPLPNTTFGLCGKPPLIDPVCRLADPEERAARLADQELQDPRDRFAQQAELWEAYVNVAEGPLFLRIGRQNLSWGESDGQRLLDNINPIDRFFGLPFDEDLEEQRIPLWMIRANLQVLRSWGPFSSVGVESFWSPGFLDTTQNPFNIGGNHPYGPPSGCDPQLIADSEARVQLGGTEHPLGGCRPAQGGLIDDGTVKASIYERLPERELGNGRYGARLVGIFARDYTFSIGAYRSWADIPQPRVHYLDLLEVPTAFIGPPGDSPLPFLPTTIVTELTHDQVNIFGGTLSFFQPRLLPGVVRFEAGYFPKEPAFVPIANIGNVPFPEDFFAGDGTFIDTFVPTADYARWVIGYDVYQLNVPWLSPTNNIIWVNQWFNELRLTGAARYRGMLEDLNLDDFEGGEPGEVDDPRLAEFVVGLSDHDGRFVTAPKYQAIANSTVQAFLMHGTLVPQVTVVYDIEGAFSFLPNVTYRLRDDLLVKLSYTGIYGKFFKPGFFRDRDQLGIRLTWLLS